MEPVCKWLESLGVMTGAVANTVHTSGKLAEELYNGVVLAKVALKLDPDIRQGSVVGRPSFDMDRRKNVKLFLDTYNRRFKLRQAKFTVKDVEMRQKTEQVVDALHNVARDLEASNAKLKAFKKPKADAYTSAEGEGAVPNYPNPYESILNFVEAVQPFEESQQKAYDYYYGHADLSYYCATKIESDLDRAVEELFAKNKQFIKALTLYEHVGRFATNDRLQSFFLDIEFINVIAKLRNFHQQLQVEFDEKTRDGAFYEVLIQNKENFLQYGKVVMVTENVKIALLETLTNEELRRQMSIVTSKVVREKILDGPPPENCVTFDSLLSYPFQHLLRIKLILERIQKEGRREVVDDEMTRGVERAIDAMADVGDYVNSYFKDWEYIVRIEEALKNVCNAPGWPAFDFRFHCGLNVLSTKVDLRVLTDTDKFRPCQLLIFQGMVMICTIEESSTLGEVHHFKLWILKDNLVDIQVTTFKAGVKVLQVRGGDGMKKMKDSMSFMIRDKPECLEILEEKFRALVRPLKSGCCQLLGQSMLNKDPKRKLPPTTVCDKCNRLLRGIIVYGVVCTKCKKKYHQECFASPDQPIEQSSAASVTSTTSAQSNQQRAITIGNKADLERLLLSTAPEGTYMFRPSDTDDMSGGRKLTLCVLVLRRAQRTTKKYHVIEEGNSFTMLQESFASLEELVHKRKRQLGLRENFMDMEDESGGSCGAISVTESIDGAWGGASVGVVGGPTPTFQQSQSSSSLEATQGSVNTKPQQPKSVRDRLRGKSPGSFVVQQDTEGKHPYVIYLMKDTGKITLHKFIGTENGDGFRLEQGTKIYKTIEDFLTAKKETFRNRIKTAEEEQSAATPQPESNGIVVERPEPVEDGVGRRRSLKERFAFPAAASLPKPPQVDDISQLDFYCGEINQEESMEQLRRQPPGTYLLRKKPDTGELRLSFTSDGDSRVKHCKVLKMSYGYRMDKIKGRTIPELVENISNQLVRYSLVKPYSRSMMNGSK